MGEGNLFPDCQASPSESSVLCTISIWKRQDIRVIRGDNIGKLACYIIEVLELPRENCAFDVGCQLCLCEMGHNLLQGQGSFGSSSPVKKYNALGL